MARLLKLMEKWQYVVVTLRMKHTSDGLLLHVDSLVPAQAGI